MMPSTPLELNIAIVEDDVILREELGHFLRSHHHHVYALVSGPALDDLFLEKSIDIVILDLNLPGESGLSIAERFRAQYPDLGIIVLSARTSGIDRIGSYDNGADIYIPKPCLPDELLAAVLSLGRRVKKSNIEGFWYLDLIKQVLVSSDNKLSLEVSAIEAQIVFALSRATERSMSSAELCDWLAQSQAKEAVSKRALENLISRLRKKFKSSDKSDFSIIRSVRNEGYQLCLPVTVSEASHPKN
jgi:DNA-binding response OmpR family regulator